MRRGEGRGARAGGLLFSGSSATVFTEQISFSPAPFKLSWQETPRWGYWLNRQNGCLRYLQCFQRCVSHHVDPLGHAHVGEQQLLWPKEGFLVLRISSKPEYLVSPGWIVPRQQAQSSSACRKMPVWLINKSSVYTILEQEHWFQPAATLLFVIVHINVQVCHKNLNWQRNTQFSVPFSCAHLTVAPFKAAYLSASPGEW